MIESDYRQSCEFLGLDYNKMIKRRFITSMPFLIMIPIVFFFVNAILSLFIIVAVFVIYKYDYVSLRKKYRIKVMNRQLDFANFFSYLIIFLQRKMNLYQSLGYSEDYLNNDFHLLVKDFREAINNDNSIAPYLDFAKKFDSDAIMEILIILFQFERNGGSDVELNNFAISLQRLHDNEIDEYLKMTIKNYDYHSFLPLVASAIMAVSFALTILSNIGGFLNV